MYSQNNEEQIIQDYFATAGITKGSFLDIGAYNGIDLSNTRKLMEQGWDGICIEPHPTIYSVLFGNVIQMSGRILCIQAALGNEEGKTKLFANETYYSTLIDSEKNRWKETEGFTEIEVEQIRFDSLYKIADYYEFRPFKFDLISIDCEGMDYAVLTQIDLADVGCKLICVETNGIETQKYVDYCHKFGMHEIARNAENLIMGL